MNIFSWFRSSYDRNAHRYRSSSRHSSGDPDNEERFSDITAPFIPSIRANWAFRHDAAMGQVGPVSLFFLSHCVVIAKEMRSDLLVIASLPAFL
jgi:hypothetical protein